MTKGSLGYLVLVLSAAALALAPSSAAAAEFPPILEPRLSLTGDCSTPGADTIPDPGCPYQPPPEGPSGRFEEARSVAIDPYGNEYVASYGGNTKGRVDVFDDEGLFITERATPAGPQSLAVDSKGNLYVLEDSEIVRYSPSVYKPEEGEIEYGTAGVVIGSVLIGGLAIDVSNDHLFVARGTEITEYSSAEEGNTHLNDISHEKLGAWSNWVAVDAQRRRLYSSYCKDEAVECGVLVFEADAPYGLLEEIDGSSTPSGKFFSTKGWLSIAVDEETGHFFIDDLEMTKNVFEFDEDYDFASRLNFSQFQGGNSLQIAVSNSPLDAGAGNRRYLFVPKVSSAGHVFAFKPPAVTTPEIMQIAATSIGENEAELIATLTPHGGDTAYVIEYVSQEEFEQSGFATAQVVAEGVVPGASATQQVGAGVSGLVPGTAYRFRIRAENEADSVEAEVAFSTYSDAPIGGGSCPNEDTRNAYSDALPDCRAYEIVTPSDTGGLPPRGVGFVGDRFPTVEASPLGSTVSFGLRGGTLPGGGGTGAFYGDQYRASRTASGWTTAGLGPSGAEATAVHPGSTSPDQGFGFWAAVEEGPAVIEGEVTRYVRYPDDHSELLGQGSIEMDPKARGVLITEDGTHIVFQTRSSSPFVAQQIEPDAPPTGTAAVYDRTPDGVVHVVSLLPGDVTPGAGEDGVYLGASPDGNGIAFEIAGNLYLRKGNAVTHEIGESVDEVGERLALAGVSEDGRRVFYVEGGDLLAFDTESEETIEFSGSGDVTVVNVAMGGSRAYFVSPSVLTGEENPNGVVAQAGEQNLYLSEEGQISFVATVTDRDVEGEDTAFGSNVDGLGSWVEVQGAQLAWDPSRLDPDGSVLLFQSRANLDGYDPGGFPQIYRFDDVGDRLHCISCIPTRQPAIGGASLQSFAPGDFDPQPFSPFGFVPGLSPDGKRAFFESREALVSYDTDEVQDVYEWEEEGVGSCRREGGCVYLITSGDSARDNYLYGHSLSGDDVFFTTGDVLTGFDSGGTPSIYDARVGGGFPEAPAGVCLGESCHLPLGPPPRLPSPITIFGGPPDPSFPRKICPKGKRKVKRNGRVRCVKKHKKQVKRPGRSGNGRALR